MAILSDDRGGIGRYEAPVMRILHILGVGGPIKVRWIHTYLVITMMCNLVLGDFSPAQDV